MLMLLLKNYLHSAEQYDNCQIKIKEFAKLALIDIASLPYCTNDLFS